MNRIPIPVPVVVIGSLTLLASAAHPSWAQGWSPRPGMGTVTFAYQMTDVRNHLFGSVYNPRGLNLGKSRDLGHVTGQGVNLSVDYVLVPNLSVSASVAWVGARYVGIRPESEILDDGQFHGTLQDASFGAAYTVPAGMVALTPSVGVTFPTQYYEHHGHAAPGSHNTSLGVGMAVARSLWPLLPNGYVSVAYIHSFVKDIESWGLDSNRYGLDMGYFLLPRITVHGYFSYFQVMSGIDWSVDDLTGTTVQHFHDAAAATLVRRAGGAIRFQFDASHSLFVDIGGVVSGQNTHNGVSYSVGTNWNFMSPFVR